MTPYRRLAGDSGVAAYRIEPDAILVEFIDGRVYTYNYALTGAPAVERMKELARQGQGLSSFISQHVRDHYAARR